MSPLERIRYASNSDKLQDALAEFKERTGHFPTNGEMPAWYLYGFQSERQLTDALDRNFLLEMFPEQPVRLLFFTNI